jgi:LacI family transcriptional regulator
MPYRRTVALLIETSNAYGRGLLDGIIAYQREHELWSIYVGEQQRGARPPGWMKSWHGDGIIARIETSAIATMVRRCKIPTVDVSAARRVPNIPWVETNDREIAQLAARHFIDRGFHKLAYCGEPMFNWSRWRGERFLEICREEGCDCSVFDGRAPVEQGFSWTRERRRMKTWLDKLPKPIGVMACYDFRGQQLLDVCREMDLAVPEQVAIIGVDNDERLCQLCTPPLSSVIPDSRGAGYRAAQLLDRMMRGERVADDGTLLSPLGIAERQSTDVYAVDDADVALALRYIREHACEGIMVSDVSRVVPLSRRMLEHRFQKVLRRSPHAEILRIRMERVARLLRETDLPVAEVASRAGFANSTYLSKAFKKYTGVSPRSFRAGGEVESGLTAS